MTEAHDMRYTIMKYDFIIKQIQREQTSIDDKLYIYLCIYFV